MHWEWCAPYQATWSAFVFVCLCLATIPTVLANNKKVEFMALVGGNSSVNESK